MAGVIVGFFGYQRSGKTLLAYLQAEKFRLQGLEVFSNMNVPKWITISSLSELPFNTSPKVLLLDEVYYFMDSRNWANNADSSIFFNTIGKQNILLMFTAISPDTVEKRLREQMNYVFLSKSDEHFINYKMIDVIRNKEKVFRLQKTAELFASVNYDTLQVPDYIDCSLKDFRKKIENYNKLNVKGNFKNERLLI